MIDLFGSFDNEKLTMKNLAILFVSISLCASSQTKEYYITASRVFDGEELHENWVVVVKGNLIVAAGPKNQIKATAGAIQINKPNSTLLPGLIEGHSHLLLYPYNITDWDTQVLKESDSYRTVRATVHAQKTLMAGFTTVRDLGTEGAGYSDVALKRSIDEGLVPGPRMLVAGRAIVATGSYGPKGYDTDMHIMLAAEQADGNDVIRIVRDQIGNGADFIKVYADYRWGANGEVRPTFSVDELKAMVETATSSGRYVVAHASSEEGMRRAIMAGVETIEHGDNGSAAVFKLMKDKGVTFFPTIAADEAVAQYRGWVKGRSPEPERVSTKRISFKSALASGVAIGMGGDVGVYAHGENAIEMELMAEYGMNPLEVLKSSTSVNAKALHLEEKLGVIKPGMLADLIIVTGDPSKNISDVRKVVWVMKDGVVYKE
jgi:imidazolonepropionase-like amidohydrolase